MIKRVCFFNSTRFWGGGEKLLLEMALEFIKRDYQTILLADPASALWDKAGTHRMDRRPVRVRNLSFLIPGKIFSLKRFFRTRQIDTVIFTTSQDLKLGSLAAKAAGVQNIVYLRGLAVPVRASLLNRYIYRSVLTHIVANSEATKQQILKKLKKFVPSEKVRVIYHGIGAGAGPVDKSVKLPAIADRKHGIVLGSAGRLTAQKGQHHLIEMARQLKDAGLDFTLFIAGTGELGSELTQAIQKNQLQDVVFLLGFVHDMEAFMNSIDIFLLTSLWEGFGFVLVEAMSRELPVVCFDLSSNPEIVTDNVSGFLAEYPDIRMFADRTKNLIVNRDLRKEMGRAARESVLKRFILEDRISELIGFLEKSR